jgi:hypothetical protein
MRPSAFVIPHFIPTVSVYLRQIKLTITYFLDTLKSKKLERIAYLFQNILVNLPKGSMTCQRVSLIEHGNPYEIPGCTPGVLVYLFLDTAARLQ